jgi:predicted pyridoxine 5'-phosphate oxidase superfamily flavin-nucleotide-binding protein/ferredoxin
MAENGWIKGSSPFHWAARAIQDRLGVREEIEKFGRRVIRDYMTAEIREFFPQLPFVLVAAVDARGRPWASILAGSPGFASSIDPRTLTVSATPVPGDPLSNVLRSGVSISVLGIEFHSRRRNSVNGRILSANDTEFKIRVDQSFGNCPQYIQRRRLQIAPSTAAKAAIHHARVLGEIEGKFIATADTFFIASYFPETSGDPAHGVDVSHRGGKPGFVRIEDEKTISWPDFVGNFQFNTLGNLSANPRAGLLFIGFETGDLLYMTGVAAIIWDREEIRAFPGCEKIVRFRIDDLIRAEASLPFRWRFEEYSPILARTGSWEQTKGVSATEFPHASLQGFQETRDAYRPPDEIGSDTVEVTFARSNTSASWDSSKGSLLELAEEIGLTPKYGCRSGMCGACAVKILAGDVEYLRPTLLEPEAGMALICKAIPKRNSVWVGGGISRSVILDV